MFILGSRNREPLFKYSMWNKFNSILEKDYVLTNNGMEAYNSSLNPTIPKNASIWTVIEIFQKEDALSKVTYNEFILGATQTKNTGRRASFEIKMNELESIALKYENIEKLEYLKYVKAIYSV